MRMVEIDAGALGAGGLLRSDTLARNYVAARMLRQEWTAGVLDRWKVIRYRWVEGVLTQARADLFIRDLWRQVFDEPAPADLEGIDLEIEFAQRVNAKLFPLALGVYDDYFNCVGIDDGSILQAAGLHFDSFGCAWEQVPIGDLHLAMQPVVACFLPVWVAEFYDVDHADYIRATDWWARRGYAEPPRPAWTRGLESGEWDPERVRMVLEALDQLPGPLDGLGVALRCCVRGNDNPFLDFVEHFFQGDYDQWGWWDWEIGSLESLTRHWRMTKPLVGVLREYYDWFTREGQAAEERVLEILLGLDAQLGLDAPVTTQDRDAPLWTLNLTGGE